MPSYTELLRHPLWQKKRLEMLNAAEWRCERCDTADVELHVHHKLYRRGAKPWEYDETDLAVLCKRCHRDAEALRDELNEAVVTSEHSLGPDGPGVILGVAQSLSTCGGEATPCGSYEQAQGIGLCWGLTADEVLACAPSDQSQIPHAALYAACIARYGTLPTFVKRVLPPSASWTEWGKAARGEGGG